jgi:hypothetical protein
MYKYLQSIILSVYPIMIIDVIILLVNSFAFYSSNNQTAFLNSWLLNVVLILVAAVLVVKKLNSVLMVILSATFLTLLWYPLLAILGYIILKSYGLLQNIENIYTFSLGVFFSSLFVLPLNLFISYIAAYIILKLKK